MNECFFIGNVIEIDKFKFILNPKVKYKSKVEMKIKLFDKNSIKAIAYDDVADYIIRNNFLAKTVFMQGKIRNEAKEIKIDIFYIKKIFK